MASAFRQDMPPPGGYEKIHWQRTFMRTWANGPRLLMVTYGAFAYVWIQLKYTQATVK